MAIKSDISLFCSGEGCLFSSHCHRYVDGRGIDKHAAGYLWMEHCEEEERQAYLSLNNNIDIGENN